MHNAVVVVAAGRGTRLGGETAKAFVPLSGAPLVVYALRTLSGLRDLTALILVAGADYLDHAREVIRQYGPWPVEIEVACGGAERQDSVAAGLARVPPETQVVSIHDAARPFVSLASAEACVRTAAAYGAAILAVPARDTIKLARDHLIERTLDRQHIWMAQTPQAFRLAVLHNAYARAQRDGIAATDDAALVERLGIAVHIVPGDSTNRKITTPDDLHWAEWHLAHAASA